MGVLIITAVMDAPIVLSQELHLDGLLASAHPMCRAEPIGRETAPSAFVRPPLPMQSVRVHREQMYYCTAAQFADDARLATIDVVKRRDGLDIESLAQPIHLGLGPGKNRWTKLTSVVTPWVRWYAVGHRRGLIRLARRITHLGQMRGAGHGQVREWTVADDPDLDPACVWVRDGLAQRNLPQAVLLEHGELGTAALEYPYWHPAQQREHVARAGSPVTVAPYYLDLLRHDANAATQHAHYGRQKQARAARRAGADGGSPAENCAVAADH